MCIRLRDRAMFGYAGIWERWTGQDGKTLDTCAIITVAANALVAAAHDRMPAIVRAEDEAAWLDPGVTDAEAILPLLGPLDERLMEMYAVSRAVNKPEADEASMIEAVDEGPDVQGQLF
jgi:putative SOS response-associated peptidase YedK